MSYISYKQLFLFCILFIFSNGVLSQKQKRFGELPIHDQKTTENQDSVPTNGKTKTELNICSKCHDMFKIADDDFLTNQNRNQFCLRLLHVKRCIKKLKKEYSFCTSIAMFALNTGVFIKRRKYNCSVLDNNKLVNISISNNNNNNVENTNNKKIIKKCRYHQNNDILSAPKHCGMFGDPHVRTFTDVRQTCIVDGAWSMLDNEYLAVQVTNQLVQTTEITSATATNKVSIVFKEIDDCLSQKIYEATSNYLPSVFKDGTQFSGPENCKTVIQKDNKDLVKIYSCHINTTIIIRKTGSYLNFNIQTPNEIANISRGLCQSGCPSTELVDSTSFFENKFNEVSKSKYFPSTQDAMKICKNKNLTDFYYDSCVFDLLTTGDELFANAAYSAMLDALELDPNLRLRRENSILESHINTERSTSSSSLKLNLSYDLLTFILLFMFMNMFLCQR